MSGSSLRRLLTLRAIERLADDRSFSRGKEYQECGQVESITEHGELIVARVAGTQDYRVKLWAKGGRLDYACDCPVGEDGEFCKHCVAAGLEWLKVAPGDPKAGKKRGRAPTTMDDIRDYLALEDRAALVDMILDRCLEDDALRERLMLKAAKRRPKIG